MGEFRIYLSGGMSGLSQEEQSVWRDRMAKAILTEADLRDYDKYDIVFFDPTKHYSLFDVEHKSEREAFEYDIHMLRNSNLVLVKFNAPNSIGTAMEIAIARELRIPVIGLNSSKYELHPWLIECCTRICDNNREIVDHIADFYLN